MAEPAAEARAGRVSFLHVIPGGRDPSGEEMAVAAIVLGALVGVVVMRRGFRGAVGGHVHIGAVDVVATWLMFLVGSAFWKVIVTHPSVAETPLGRAAAFIHS